MSRLLNDDDDVDARIMLPQISRAHRYSLITLMSECSISTSFLHFYSRSYFLVLVDFVKVAYEFDSKKTLAPR